MNLKEKMQQNHLKSRQDMEHALIDLVTPVYQKMASDHLKGAVHLGDSGAVYGVKRQNIEGFLRTLWGLGPLFSQKAAISRYPKLKNQAEEGILAGTDPDSPFYWGILNDYDQLFVEMGSLATYLILTRETFFDTLTKIQQENIKNWLNQINQHTIPPTNWLFFRILVNTFFQQIGFIHEKQMITDLKNIHSYYLNEGWYFDGYQKQIDYYIPFGMQYYGLLFSALTKENLPDKAIFQNRSLEFTKTFKEWFVKDGTALPFGRSLTYRFAQSSFFAVKAFANVFASKKELGEEKYLLLQNMRQWFKKPIYTSEGFLTIGYGYPNLVMAEGYNAPGSPYWSFKNFIILALPETHDFWQSPELAPTFSSKSINSYSKMILCHNQSQTDLVAFTMGQHSHEHAHGASKYEKYAYSTTFGFSVPKGNVLVKQGGFDSTLAVSLGENNFQTVFDYDKVSQTKDYFYGLWKPFPQTEIQTYVIPGSPWHLRFHFIETTEKLHFQVGSFSVPREGAIVKEDANSLWYESRIGTTGIEKLAESPGELSLQQVEPNTNLLYPETMLPISSGILPKGKHLLAYAFLGAKEKADVLPLKNCQFTLNENQLRIQFLGKNIEIPLENKP